VLVLDGKTLVYDRPFSHDGINYPANWLRLTTLVEKQAIGIVEVADPVQEYYDQRFWWGVGNPKDIDQLKTTWKTQTSDHANSLLSPSDWYAIRKADTAVDIPTAWAEWRQSIRVAASTKQTAIDSKTSVADLETYITTNTGADSDYPVWPLDPDQPVVESNEEQVTSEETNSNSEETNINSAGTVSGGVVSTDPVDTIDLGE
jgi:hypothetical protein